MKKPEFIRWVRGSHGLFLLTVFAVSLSFSSCDLKNHKVSTAQQMVSDYESGGSSSRQTDSRESKLRALLNKISPDDFRSYLKSYAESLASEWYGGGGPSGWIVKDSYILNNEMSSAVELSDRAAKKCSCTVHVNMEGAMGLGLRSGSVNIWVEGTLGIVDFDGENGRLQFSRGGYSKQSVEGGLKRRG
ncbi:MAG: hypothetical protein J6X01_03275 [Bacteroidales bacterium]|nr:hypothetical protein [Bacteroidales bacterium]